MRGCLPPVGHLPSPFMAFLRFWASSVALKPAAALTVPPLAAWVHRERWWLRGTSYQHGATSHSKFAEHPPWARHPSRCWDTAVTVRDEALAPLELRFKFSRRQTSKRANKQIFHQAAGGEKGYRADREVLEGLLWGVTFRLRAEWQEAADCAKIRAKCYRQRKQLRQRRWGWSCLLGEEWDRGQCGLSWWASWGVVR